MSSNQTRLVKVGNVVLDPSEVRFVYFSDEDEKGPKISILFKNHPSLVNFTGQDAEALRLFFEDLCSFGE